MESKQKSALFTQKKRKILFALLSISILVGAASAAVFTMYYTANTATVQTPDVRFVAGPDSGGSSYPGATVTVASTHDYANVAFSLFPSVTNTPQPATYYTNLLQITNAGTVGHTIEGITISDLTGAINLGKITVYVYATQTDSPTTGTPIASVDLTSTSDTTSAPISVFSGSQSIAASTIYYIEIVGYASATATAGSTISFNIAIQWV